MAKLKVVHYINQFFAQIGGEEKADYPVELRVGEIVGPDVYKRQDLEYVRGSLKLLGSKGTTGTQASFLELFDGDQETIDKIDPMIARKMGFQACYPVSGQTYSRKVDTRVLNVLAGIAASAHKFSNDIRLLQHLKEVEEPFEPRSLRLPLTYSRSSRSMKNSCIQRVALLPTVRCV